MKLVVLCSAVIGIAGAFVFAAFYSGIFGAFAYVLFVPGAIALVCAFRLQSQVARTTGFVASIACMPVIFLGCAAFAQYGLPRFGR